MTTTSPPTHLKKLFEADLKDITKNIASYYPGFSQRHKQKIAKAFWYAAVAHEEEVRFSGEPYFTHPIAATRILLQIKPDVDTICACLMHDVIEDTEITAEDMEREFGAEVRFLCEGVEKVAKVRLRGQEREHESLRKLFIAMAQDIRVIFIKLADRIHNLQTLDHVRPDKRQRIAEESMKIYASVAEKLGLFEFKQQIEDLCFKALHEDVYLDIEAQTQKFFTEKAKFISEANAELAKVMKKEKIPYVSISGRYKNLYSIFRKLKRKNFSHVSEIFDLVGVRIILKHNSDCYRCLGAIHGHWKPVAARFKDYIAVPKPNGYQSLHTTILGVADSTTPTEIQIRTEKMHLDAEFGPAAHWAYKETRSSNFDEKYLAKMSWLPEDIQETGKIPEAAQFFEKITENLALDRIHVFTPLGDLKNLVKGATIIDFAYAIHSDLGHTCIAGKINGVIKPLNQELKNGDVVEIITRKGRVPNPLWLNFAKSSSARSHIRNYLNKHDIKTVLPEAKVETEKPVAPKKSRPSRPPVISKSVANQDEILVGGEKTGNFQLSSCCKPKVGNAIVAYVPRGNHFSIHRADCKTLDRLESERVLEANFIYTNRIAVEGTDRPGMMRQIFDVLDRHSQNIIRSKLSTDGPNNKQVRWEFVIESRSVNDFQNTQKELNQIPNVRDVKQI